MGEAGDASDIQLALRLGDGLVIVRQLLIDRPAYHDEPETLMLDCKRVPGDVLVRGRWEAFSSTESRATKTRKTPSECGWGESEGGGVST